jgi:hypothetical protein
MSVPAAIWDAVQAELSVSDAGVDMATRVVVRLVTAMA